MSDFYVPASTAKRLEAYRSDLDMLVERMEKRLEELPDSTHENIMEWIEKIFKGSPHTLFMAKVKFGSKHPELLREPSREFMNNCKQD